jgi:hypothetical protein
MQCYTVWWKSSKKRSLRRPRHRWQDGIRMDLKEAGCQDVERIQLAQDRDWWWTLVNMVMILQVLVPQNYLVS